MITISSIFIGILGFSFLIRERINSFHMDFQMKLKLGDSCRYRHGHDFNLGTVHYVDSWHVVVLDAISGDKFDVSIDQIRPA